MKWKLPVMYDKLDWRERREVRQQYITKQDQKCMHCNEYIFGDPAGDILATEVNWDLFPGGVDFLKHPIHLQHNHCTGLTEGAVHARCNAVMWQYHER